MLSRYLKLFDLNEFSLSVSRIYVGILILFEGLVRLTDFRFLYSEMGVFPRIASLNLCEPNCKFSAMYASNNDLYLLLFFFGQVAAGAWLATGIKSTLATVVCWVLLSSIHVRYMYVLNAGDKLLVIILFWLIFLPLDKHLLFTPWQSKTLRGRTKKVKNHFNFKYSICCLVYTLQVSIIYFSAGFIKKHSVWAEQGSAVYFALNMDYFAKRAIADWILELPFWVLRFLTFATLYLERYGPLLLFCPFFKNTCRVLAVISFIGLHFSFFLTLRLGFFPFICIGSWIPFFPHSFWEFLHIGEAQHTQKKVTLENNLLPNKKIQSGLSGMKRYKLWFENIKVFSLVILICSVIYTNLINHYPNSLHAPKFCIETLEALNLDQKWSMFTPIPIYNKNGWIQIPGYLANNRSVDTYRGLRWAKKSELEAWEGKHKKVHPSLIDANSLDQTRPPDPSSFFKNQRYRKIFTYFYMHYNPQILNMFSQALCRKWNQGRNKDDFLASFQIIHMNRITPTYEQRHLNVVEPILLWVHVCYEEATPRNILGQTFSIDD